MTDLAENVNLARFSSFNVGGNADFFTQPKTENDFFDAIEWAKSKNMPIFILGGGTNLVISDDGIEGLTIHTGKMDEIRIDNDEIWVQCGAKTNDLVNFCREKGLSGFEKFAGLPGTVGGALFMNARCYEKSICENLIAADFFDLDKSYKETYTFCQSHWDYKKSPFMNNRRAILAGRFRKSIGTPEEIQKSCDFYLNSRREKHQFDFPSAGSVFKNNHSFGKSSGAIIDEAGLKGTSRGGAKVADFHGNFIINTGGATAKDIFSLVQIVKKEVQNKFGFQLECEIRFVGRGFLGEV